MFYFIYSFFNLIEIWLIYSIVLVSGVQQRIHLYIYMYSYMLLSHFSRVRLFATPWTVTHQAPLSVEFSRQEYWSWVAISLSKIFIYIYIYIHIYICICQFFSRFFSITGNNKVWVQFPTLYSRFLLVIYFI